MVARALFVVDAPAEASLPRMADLHYLDGAGVRRGGFSIVGPVPAAGTVVVLVDTSLATLALMKLSFSYLFVEEVADEPAG